jgi:hypothetical protein
MALVKRGNPYRNPAQHTFYSIVAVVLAITALIASNLGGFFIGTLLGVIGGSLGFAWTPGQPPPSRPRVRRHAPADAGPSEGLGLILGDTPRGAIEPGTGSGPSRPEAAGDAHHPELAGDGGTGSPALENQPRQAAPSTGGWETWPDPSGPSRPADVTQEHPAEAQRPDGGRTSGSGAPASVEGMQTPGDHRAGGSSRSTSWRW